MYVIACEREKRVGVNQLVSTCGVNKIKGVVPHTANLLLAVERIACRERSRPDVVRNKVLRELQVRNIPEIRI